MKKQFLGLTMIMSLVVFGLSGCGGSSESTVVQPAQEEPGLTEQETSDYEAEMMEEQGN